MMKQIGLIFLIVVLGAVCFWLDYKAYFTRTPDAPMWTYIMHVLK